MTKLTKEKAEELNLLFEKMLTWEGVNSIGHINFFLVAKEIDRLKSKSDKYLRGLIYIARQEQKNIPKLFDGDTLLVIYETSIIDFIEQGGFVKLYKTQTLERRKDNFRFYSLFIITIITLFVTIYQVWPSDKESPLETQKEKQLKQEQQPLHQDSTKIQKTKTIPKNDTSKK